MPWLSIIMALISFFITKKKTGSTTAALAAGAIAGVGTYTLTHYTDWGQANLGSLDGIAAPATLTNPDGTVINDDAGNPIVVPAGSSVAKLPDGTYKVNANGTVSVVDSIADVLKSWGGVGTAAVIGTTAVSAGGSDKFEKWFPYLLIGGMALLILK